MTAKQSHVRKKNANKQNNHLKKNLSFILHRWEQYEAYVNSTRWSKLVGLEPVYIHMWVTQCKTIMY